MKDEYDFSGAVRGKFFDPNAVLELPIYLHRDVMDYLRERADAKGIEVGDLVNDILRRDIELVEAVK